MRDVVVMFVAGYFYCTAVIVVIGLFSRTLMTNDDGSGTKTTYGLWELCTIPTSNPTHSSCSLFYWQDEVKDSVAADRVRAILGFGTMTFIGAVVILTSPGLFPLFVYGKVTERMMTFFFLVVSLFMGVMGSITWSLMGAYFEDIRVDDLLTEVKYGWGATVFRVGVGMTSLCIPVIVFCALWGPNAVYPVLKPPPRENKNVVRL